MRKTKWLACLLLVLSAGNPQAWAVTAPDINPATIDALQAQRQHFGDGAQVDPQQLANDVQAAITDAVALDRLGNAAGAIGRLEDLKQYAPLDRFPDIDVQTLCGGLYRKLLEIDLGNACHDRAQALAEILKNRSGSGATPDDPVRVVMVREISEWVRLQRGTIKSVEAQRNHGNDLQKVSYSTPGADGTTSAYFLVDPRVVAATMRQHLTFDPLPIDAGADNQYAKALRQAHEQRLQFLADRSFDYPRLMQQCHDAEKQAMKLAQQGDFDGALATMQAIEKIRPIRQIPDFNVISVYSYLLGKTGHLSEQAEMRLFLFGITQDIAHSGDGLSTATAIHVVSDDEEYTWLASRHQRLTRQALLENGRARYDELSTVDADGHAQPPYYFEVSQAFIRESPVPVQ